MTLTCRKLYRSNNMCAQGGQALVEFLVVATVLIPLMLLIPIIAKYQDIGFTTQMASRYAAFDAIVRNDAWANSAKTIEQLQDEVRRRFFSNPEAPIKTWDTAGDFKAHQNLFWRHPGDQPMISEFKNITVTRETTWAHDVEPVFAQRFGEAGIRSATVKVIVANVPEVLRPYETFNNLNLSVSRTTGLVVDSWAVAGPQIVQGKLVASKLYPGTALATLSPDAGALQGVDSIMRVVEPGVSLPRLGKLDAWTDVVPADRLKGN
jgi:hypothetical protein